MNGRFGLVCSAEVQLGSLVCQQKLPMPIPFDSDTILKSRWYNPTVQQLLKSFTHTHTHPHTCTHTNTHSPTHKRRKKVYVEKDFHEKEERCSSRERERTHWLRITPFLVPSTSKPQPKILLTVNGPFSQPFWFKRAHAHAHALEHTLTRTQTLRLSLACLHIWIHRNHLSPARASTHTRNSHTHFDR